MNRPHWIPCCSVLIIVLFVTQARAVQLIVDTNGGVTDLSIDAQPPLYPPFHTTAATVTEATLIDVDGSLLLMHWKETIGGNTVPYYAFSFDVGQNVSRVRRTSYDLRLCYAHFDPTVCGPPLPHALDSAGFLAQNRAITQFDSLGTFLGG